MKLLFNVFIFLLLVFSCNIGEAIAQYGNVWAFGRNAGIDFNTNIPIQTSINTSEGSASICNQNGQLLFYTDGTTVWDKNHNQMPNGNDLPGLERNVTASTTQGALIVPIPGDSYKYYLFSLACRECVPHQGKLFYSIVDMRLNNGLGDVESANKGILLDTLLTEHLSAVSGNDCNIWLIVVDRVENKFKAYNIGYRGIDTIPVISERAQGGGNYTGDLGSLDFAPDRARLAIAQGNLVVYDFDPDLGLVSNAMIIDTDVSQNFYGVTFSPDGTKVYGGAQSSIFQFDLSSNNITTISSSKTLLGQSHYSAVKRAPDGKIYCASSGRESMHVVNLPDIAGTACGFVLNGFDLLQGTASNLGLPNLASLVEHKVIYTTQRDSFCSGGGSMLIRARDSSGRNYEWNTGNRENTLWIDTPGTYWVRYQLASSICKEQVDTFHIQFKYLSSKLDIVAACKYAHNGIARYRKSLGDTASYYFIWKSTLDTATLSTHDSLSGISSGDYYVHIINSEGCDTTLYFTIPEEDYKVSFSSDTLVCEGDEVFFLNNSDNHFDEWYWDFGNGDTSSLDQSQHVYREPGTYRVMLSGIGKVCSDTAYRTINVDARADTLMFLAEPSSICRGENILFTPFTDASVSSLHWDFGDQTHFSSSLEQVQHAYDISGMMYVHLTARFRACPDLTYRDSIMVYDFPKVSLGPDSFLCYQGKPITLKNIYDHQEGDAYFWSTGSRETFIEVVHHGDYSLTVANEQGCSATEWVHVSKDCYVDIPNAFTPNGDGLNDYFFPRQLLSSNVSSFKFYIYNRWGQLIFETSNTDGRGWDGRFNGKEQPMSVYVYIMEVVFNNGNGDRYEGNVTLMR